MNKSIKIKPQTPVSVIVHGGDYLGFLLAQTLIEQGSQVVIIDSYTSESKRFTNLLKKKGDVTFINFNSLNSFLENLGRIDYLYYNIYNLVNQKDVFESKEFLTQTDRLNISLKYAQKFKAKISIITSLRLNRELANTVNNDNISQPSPYSNIELQKYCENLTAEFRDQTKSNLRIIRLATVIGKGIDKLSDPILHNLFKDGTSKNQIDIVGEGLDIHNVIDQTDAIYGVLKLTFSDRTRGEVITLSNPNDYTTLSMAYKLLELNVSAQTIKFNTDPKSRLILQDLYVPAPNASKFGWKPQSIFENSMIDQIVEYYDQSDKKWNIPNNNLPEKKVKSKEIVTTKGKVINKIKNIFKRKTEKKMFEEINYGKLSLYTTISIIGLALIYFLISPIIGIIIGSTVIYSNSNNLKDNIISYDFDSAQTNLKSVDTHVEKIFRNIHKLDWIFSIFNRKDILIEIDKISLGLEYALDSGYNLIEGLEPLALYIKDFQPSITFGSTQPNSTREYREYLTQIDQYSYLTQDGAYKLNLANEVIDSVVVEVFPKFSQQYVLDLKNLSSELNSTVESVGSIVSFLPEILGNTERRRYLILLQNEGELRSTGGWISSYAVVGLEGGQIRELYVDDIYNADGTLKVQGKRFTPPQSLSNALEITEYPFALVNWSPDLYNVLLESQDFISALGKGNDLDGIFTIDISFIQKLLDQWGGIEVPGESELITSSNLYTKIFEMHEEFTPGSDRKSTFLANLANETVTKILSSDFDGYKDILSVFTQSLDEKHLQGVFKNSEATQFFDNNNWDGQLDRKYISAPIDIDWNWGANKANLYIKKDHALNIEIEDDSITYNYEINIVNESTQDNYPQGGYINYQRIYIPSTAQILSIEGLENNEYDIYNDSGFKVVGGWFNTLIQSGNTFSIRYRIDKKSNPTYYPVSTDNNTNFFDLNIYKQPGTKQESYVLNISYPENWNVLENDGLTNISNQLSRRLDLISDTEFDITWTTP